MKPEKFLEKLITKAVAAGWKPFEIQADDKLVKVEVKAVNRAVFQIAKNKKDKTRIGVMVMMRDILFDHGFAKTIWGEKIVRLQEFKTIILGIGNVKQKPIDMLAWRYHLQQLVLQKDYADYLMRTVNLKKPFNRGS